MARLKLFWDPAGLELNAIGTNRFVRITDGDTPYVSMAIRMLSIDTPEVHYPGNQDPSRHDEKLAELAGWMQESKAPLHPGLASYLHPKVATGHAGTLQKQQAEAATAAFQKMLDLKLTKPNGEKRPLFLRTANEPFDQYGRILAYISPNYNEKEREGMSRQERATFNLMMVESGWAASFPIYPSLPRHADLLMLKEAAEEAFQNNREAWADPIMLTGYEFRMCYKLWEVTRKLVRGEALSSREKIRMG